MEVAVVTRDLAARGGPALFAAVLASAALAAAAPAAPKVGSGVAWGSSPVIVFTAFAGGIYASPQGGAVRRITANGGGISVFPDGRTLLFTADCQLYRIHLSGQELRRLGYAC